MATIQKKSTADTMNEFNLDSQLGKLGMTPAFLAMLTGVNKTTVWRWRTGRTPIPKWVRILLIQRNTVHHLLGHLFPSD